MIKIDKTYPAPDYLKSLPVPADENEVDKCRYNHPLVKSILKSNQHGKCCYCETYLNKYDDIEHFRPKKGYIDRRGIMHKPGYYWLTAEWSNLLMSCKTCNSSHKKNHFGLVDERTRNISHKDISREMPLLVNPLTEDPGMHIRFRRHCAVEVACGGNAERGRYTISILQLNRPGLRWMRRKVWEQYLIMVEQLHMAEELLSRIPDDSDVIQLVDTCRKAIRGFQSVRAQYSGMINRQF